MSSVQRTGCNFQREPCLTRVTVALWIQCRGASGSLHASAVAFLHIDVCHHALILDQAPNRGIQVWTEWLALFQVMCDQSLYQFLFGRHGNSLVGLAMSVEGMVLDTFDGPLLHLAERKHTHSPLLFVYPAVTGVVEPHAKLTMDNPVVVLLVFVRALASEAVVLLLFQNIFTLTLFPGDNCELFMLVRSV